LPVGDRAGQAVKSPLAALLHPPSVSRCVGSPKGRTANPGRTNGLLIADQSSVAAARTRRRIPEWWAAMQRWGSGAP